MRFGDPRAADTQPPQLTDIAIFGGPWRTPEGIRIGSLLSAVLKAYGDSMEPPLPSHVSSCLDLQIIRSPEVSPPMPPSLVLTYPRGVGFHVGLSTTQKVEVISVVQAKVPPECF
jgi:hypothetical protein